jgi:hypothetical protein
MRRILFPALLGLAVLGTTLTLPGQAHAQVAIAPSAAYYPPVYGQPVYAPPVYASPVYAPVAPYASYYRPGIDVGVGVGGVGVGVGVGFGGRPGGPIYGRPIERRPYYGTGYRGYEPRYERRYEPYRRW